MFFLLNRVCLNRIIEEKMLDASEIRGLSLQIIRIAYVIDKIDLAMGIFDNKVNIPNRFTVNPRRQGTEPNTHNQ